MVSTTSGTTDFTLDVDEIIESALENLGGEHTSGNEAKSARRELNLILIELSNKNITLNKLATTTQAVTSGDHDYTLDTSIKDVLEATIKKDTENYEVPIKRWGLREYHEIPNKSNSDRPTLWATERLNNNVNLKLWPVPNAAYTLNLFVSKKIEDVNAAYQKLDLPPRYLPLVVKWLRYEMSLKRVGIDENTKNRLQNDYLRALPDAFDEDRERVDMSIRPGGISGR